MENGWPKWTDRTGQTPSKYTDAYRKIHGVCGWGRDAYMRFNEICKDVSEGRKREDRAQREMQFCEDAKEVYGKKQQSDMFAGEPFEVFHEL